MNRSTGTKHVRPFETKQELIAVLSALWDRIVRTPEIAKPLSGTKLLAQFRFSDFDTSLYLDAKGDDFRFYWDPEVRPVPDVEMILSSETAHKFWMEDLNVPLAIAGRKIIAKGSVQKALKLLPAIKPAFALYPETLREMGRTDLLAQRERAVRRWKFRLFRGKGKARRDVSGIPKFPLDFASERYGPLPKRGDAEVARVSEFDLLRTMYRIRYFEQHLSQAFQKGELPTEAIHLSIGQEAIAAAVCMNLRDSDYLNTTHRGHGHLIAKGADINRMMAEIYGKSDGLCHGKGGSMHVTDRGKSILGANGIVGANYLLAMGAAFSIQRTGRDDVSVVIAGDGSVNQGMFHEAANMISLLRLPVLIVIENNRYGEFTPVERHSAVPEVFKRAAAYRIEAQQLDGNDVKPLYEAVRDIVERMRRDGAPRLIECMTYRWHGHMEGEPELYRSQEEKERFKLEDPIRRLEHQIAPTSPEYEARIERMRQEAQLEIENAVEFARRSPPPPLSTLTTDVYTPEDRSLFSGSFGEPGTSGEWKEVSVAASVNEAIAEEMARDETVFLWGEDVTLGGYFNVTEGLVAQFGPNRIIDTPISENAIVGGAVGAAMTGMRPVAEILFGDFLACCMDPILNQAAKLRYMTGGQISIPLTIRTPVGSGIGMAAQHSQSMERFFCGIPGLLVAAPSDPYTTKGLLKAAIRSDNPVLFIEHKLLYAVVGKIPTGEYLLPLGKARRVKEGSDVTIVSHLLGVSISLDAARILERAGIRAEVIDLLSLYPIDTDTILSSVEKTRRLVTVEEGVGTLGIGSEVIARVVIAGHGLLKAPPVRIAAPECPIAYARNLENAVLPTPEEIAARIEGMLG